MTFISFPIRRAASLLKCGKGVAAIEFAFVAPLIFLLLFGAVELTNAITSQRRLEIVASSIAQMVAATPSPSASCNPTTVLACVNYVDLQYATDATMVLFPLVLSDSAAKGVNWSSDISITISSVLFTKVVPTCTFRCAYTAKVSWSTGAAKRPCHSPLLPAVNDYATPTPTTLPPDAYAAGSAIVVDVAYNYQPKFLTTIVPTITFHRSAYLPPRNVLPTSSIAYSVIAGDPGAATVCS